MTSGEAPQLPQLPKIPDKVKLVLSGGTASGKTAPPVGTIEIGDVKVSSVQQSSAGGKPVETVALSFADLEVATAAKSTPIYTWGEPS